MTPHEGSGQLYGAVGLLGEFGQGLGRFTILLPLRIASSAEVSHSGLVRTLGKRVGGNPSRVQIP